MAITVDWHDNARTIVQWIFPAHWTWADYDDAQAASNTLLAGADYTVDIIGDLTASSSLPPAALSAYKNTLRRSADNTGLIVLVGSSFFIKAMVSALKAVVPGTTPGTDFAFADTIEAAEALIRQRQAARQ